MGLYKQGMILKLYKILMVIDATNNSKSITEHRLAAIVKENNNLLEKTTYAYGTIQIILVSLNGTPKSLKYISESV